MAIVSMKGYSFAGKANEGGGGGTSDIEVVQEFGSSKTAVMSQKAVTEQFKGVANTLSSFGQETTQMIYEERAVIDAYGKSIKEDVDEQIAGIPDSIRDTLVEDGIYNNNTDTLPLLCGQPMTLFGKGTPQNDIVPDNWKQYDPVTGEGYDWNGSPSALGQVYINYSATSNGRYTAVPDGVFGLVWKNF